MLGNPSSMEWQPRRTVVTIDGMRSVGACTDKMDPVTSYVEVSNLSKLPFLLDNKAVVMEIRLVGSIDLKKPTPIYKCGLGILLLTQVMKRIIVRKSLGLPSIMRIVCFILDTDVMFRDAENYKAGNIKEIPV